jgi:hypothetical protein
MGLKPATSHLACVEERQGYALLARSVPADLGMQPQYVLATNWTERL